MRAPANPTGGTLHLAINGAFLFRSFPRKREPRGRGGLWPWVPACAGTSGRNLSHK
jgi:hypothetical protein